MKLLRPVPGDYICLAAVLAAGILLLLAGHSLQQQPGDEALSAVVTVNGNVEGYFPLEENRVFRASSGVTVTIENGTAFVSDSDCPDGLCMKCKAISNQGQMVVCLPRKTTLKIVGGQQEADAIV